VNPRIAAATAGRVLRQLRHDPRTVALLLLVPCALVALLKYVFEGSPVFDRVGGPMLGIFPLITMFIVTSITMLLDLLLGYGAAFALVAAVQAGLVSALAFGALDLHVIGPKWGVAVLAVANAVLGTALGLFVSAFARTEFQAVQFMPAFILPQLLLCGLLVPRGRMAHVLEIVSWGLPLSYSYGALDRVTRGVYGTGLVAYVAAVCVFIVVALGLGALTLRRRTS
jgi:ABC-type multidrug transport system permease subunit